MKKRDFVVSGVHKSNWNNGKLLKYWKGKTIGYIYSNAIDEDAPKSKIIRTKRGITLKANQKKVIRKYGRTKVIKVNKKVDNLYWVVRKILKDKESANLIKKSKTYVEYTYKKRYKIRFYFDRKNRITTIAYLYNETRFRFADWSKQ